MAPLGPDSPANDRIGRPHARFGLVLLLQFGLVFWLVAFDPGRDNRILLNVTGVIIPLCAMAVVTKKKRQRRIAVGLALLAMVFSGGALSGLRPAKLDLGPPVAAAFSAYSAWILLRRILSSQRVTGDILAGALAAYIGSGLAFAVVYGVIETHRPDAFYTAAGAHASFPDLVYFSFVTLLTIGFGDVTPVAPLARALVLFEGLFGVSFMTIVMAALVAAYLRQRDHEMRE